MLHAFLSLPDLFILMKEVAKVSLINIVVFGSETNDAVYGCFYSYIIYEIDFSLLLLSSANTPSLMSYLSFRCFRYEAIGGILNLHNQLPCYSHKFI